VHADLQPERAMWSQVVAAAWGVAAIVVAVWSQFGA
jgi:hypothetical protein